MCKPLDKFSKIILSSISYNIKYVIVFLSQLNRVYL